MYNHITKLENIALPAISPETTRLFHNKEKTNEKKRSEDSQT